MSELSAAFRRSRKLWWEIGALFESAGLPVQFEQAESLARSLAAADARISSALLAANKC